MKDKDFLEENDYLELPETNELEDDFDFESILRAVQEQAGETEETSQEDESWAESVYAAGEAYLDEIAYSEEEEAYPEDEIYPVEEAADAADEEEQVFYENTDDRADVDLKTGKGKFRSMTDRQEPELKNNSQDRPTYKGRPRRKKGAGLLGIPHLLATLIWLLLILAIGVSLGRVIWVCAADVLAFGRENKEVVVTISEEDSVEDIAQKLYDGGLIHYPDLFLLYADIAKVEEKGKIGTGTFTLNTVYDYMALVTAMSPSSSSRVIVEDVLIPEGYSCRQIFERLEEKGVCTVEELEAYAASGELDEYWFLADVERGDKYCLEGFLFPATYDFYENSSARQVLEKMLDAFDVYFTDEMNAQLETLNQQLAQMMRSNGYGEEYIAENLMSLRDVITVASLVEEETSSITEGYKIASVIYNRLTNQKEFPYLNIDATIIYALDGDTELTSEKMQVDSPYNSYTNKGLVPGPITNPGLASIQAALDPDETDYYYYVYDESAGEHIFSRTYAEHQAAGG